MRSTKIKTIDRLVSPESARQILDRVEADAHVMTPYVVAEFLMNLTIEPLSASTLASMSSLSIAGGTRTRSGVAAGRMSSAAAPAARPTTSNANMNKSGLCDRRQHR